MIGFAETMTRLGAVSLADIQRVEEQQPNEHKVMRRRVIMRNGTSFETFAEDNQGLLARPVQLIAAEAGISLMRWDVSDPEAPEVWRETVIAWALCLDGEIRAVSPNGVNGGMSGSDNYVEMPNGKIEAVGEWTDPCCFRDVNDMLSHFVSRNQRIIHRAIDEGKA